MSISLQQAISGYARALAGEELGYRSFHPYASEALLVRCLDQRHPIEWETSPVPTELEADTQSLCFVWVAAHSSGTSAADATFTLEVEGEPVLDFTTVQAERVRQWTVTGRHGISLSFQAIWEDTVADLFGYMRLQVPVSRLRPGHPLRLRLIGEDAGRRDWAMAFKYRICDSVSVQAQPALLDTPAGPRQLVHALFDILEPQSSATLCVPGQEPQHAVLSQGFNRVSFHVPEAREAQRLAVVIQRPGHEDSHHELLLQPVPQREIWVLAHSHVDVGYSDLQVDVEHKQLKNLRDAMDLHERTAHYPAGSRFKWNTEIAWPVQRFLVQASAEERERLFQTLRAGGIGLNAFYTNPLTGICRPEEILRLSDDARRIAAQAGIQLRDAMITDIPGSSWATATALAQAGIRYYSSGPNYNPGLCGGGDRVGHFNTAWGDRPFYWLPASGEERILCWVAGRGYSAFHGSALRLDDTGSATRLLDYMRELQEGDYPYDMVQLRYTIGGDNGPVDAHLPDFVRDWNQRHITPRMVLATADELFSEFERRWGHTLPTHAGEISPYWEDGALSTLRELTLARRASERLLQVEALAAILPGAVLDREQLEEAWRLQHLSDEHTWGAWNSVSEPDCDFVREQWRVKRSYMEGVDRTSRDLLAGLLDQAPRGGLVEVINSSSWQRSELVQLPDAPGAGEFHLVDDAGEAHPCQRLCDGALVFVARELPALGARRYELRAGACPIPSGVSALPDGLDNGLIRLRVDRESGALASLRDGQGREFVRKDAGLNSYVRISGVDPPTLEQATVLSVELVEAGPVLGLVRVKLKAKGSLLFEVDYSLVAGGPQVEIRNALLREDAREKEAIHFSFPMWTDEGQWRLDAGWGLLEPGQHQLEGSCRDFLCAGRWLDFSTADQGLTCTTVDTPLMEVGALVDESPDAQGRRQWRRELPLGAEFHTYAMNNYWHTNYAASQPGPAELRHRLFPHQAFDPVQAFRQGVEAGQPVAVRRVEATAPLVRAPFRLLPDAVLVSSLGRSRDGEALMVRLFNATPDRQDLRVQWEARQPARVLRSSINEEAGPALEANANLGPWGLLTLRCEF